MHILANEPTCLTVADIDNRSSQTRGLYNSAGRVAKDSITFVHETEVAHLTEGWIEVILFRILLLYFCPIVIDLIAAKVCISL